MTEDTRLDPLPDLPPDLAELDRELAELAMEERPSFAPELEAELAREWARRPPGAGTPFLRPAMASAAVLVAILGLSVPPARASLVEGVQRLLSGFQEPTSIEVELPVGDGESLPLGIDDDATAALDAPEALPPLESVPAYAQGVVTYPTLRDRNADAEAALRHYPRALQLAGIGGTVELAFWVDSTGTVDHVQIGQSSGTPELDRAAREAARELRFDPMTRNGRPDGTWVQFPLTFTPPVDVVRMTGPVPAAPSSEPEWTPTGDWAAPMSITEPTLLETRDLLKAALDPRSETVRSPDAVDALLAGDPPTGVNPLAWRNEAAEELQRAMQRDPDNPAPYLALARIRRAQGLRNDARLLFEQGLRRAEQGSRPVSPGLVAELAWEHGRVTRESWLGWRGLGEVPLEALNSSRCSLVSGTGVGVATAEQLVAWNFNCPDALQEIFRDQFRLRPEGDADADRMLTSFARAVEAWPAHVEANTEILLALADEEAWLALLNGARRFASASRGHPTAYLMSGLALHRLGRSEEAVADFERAFDRMDAVERRAFRDPGILRSSEDEPDGRAFWRTLDPILSTEVNEREVEHWARAAYASLRFSSLDADASRVWLRYGRPLALRAFGSASGIRTEFWDYGEGPDVTFHRPMSSANGALTPESEDYLDDLRGVFPHQYGARGRAIYALPAQAAHFRGRMHGSTEVEFHFRVPAEMVRSSTDSLDLGLYFLGADGRRLDQVRQRIAGDAGVVRRLAPAGPEVRTVVLELWNASTGVAAAVRVAAHPDAASGDATVSDLLLVEPGFEPSRTIDRGAPGVRPRVDGRLEGAEVGVVFELYDLPARPVSYRLRFEVVGADGELRPVAHRPVGVESWATSWARSTGGSVERTEASTLRLGDLPAGRWTLRAIVDFDDGSRRIRSLDGLTRGVASTPVRSETGGWEQDLDGAGWMD